MSEPAMPYPDPGPATTRPRPSPNGTAPPGPPVPPEPSVPPMPSEVTKERNRSPRPAGGAFRMVMLPLRRWCTGPRAIRSAARAGARAGARPVLARASARRPPPVAHEVRWCQAGEACSRYLPGAGGCGIIREDRAFREHPVPPRGLGLNGSLQHWPDPPGGPYPPGYFPSGQLIPGIGYR